jgi:hypothetical protein
MLVPYRFFDAAAELYRFLTVPRKKTARFLVWKRAALA